MIERARTHAHVRFPRPGSGRSRAVWLSCVATVAGLGIAGLPASAAHADEAVARPESGSILIEGRGFGHGRGMSQWGAYGAADAGLTWRQILQFYYPGTKLDRLGRGSIKVWISGDNDRATTVLAAPGLTATVGRTARLLPTGRDYRAWRVQADRGGTLVQRLDAKGVWQRYQLPVGPAVVFRATGGIVRVALPSGGSQDLRGAVIAHNDGGTVKTVLDSTMESYLRSVVPNEMPSSWNVQALAAQSVAARTYAAAYRDRQRAKRAVWDICDTISCQVFKGVAQHTKSGVRVVGENKRSDAAIAATSGTVLRASAKRNAPFAFAEFSASNGGYSVAGGPSYQVAKPDPYDVRMKNPNIGWTATVPVTALEKAFGLGKLISVQIIDRDGRGELGGRVQDVQLTGSTRAVTVSGTKIRQTLKLRSDWFVVKPVEPVKPPPAKVPAAKR